MFPGGAHARGGSPGTGTCPLRIMVSSATGPRATCALVGRDGAISWLCIPEFDSPPFLAGILDLENGGLFEIAPVSIHSAAQRYMEDSCVLVTTLASDRGTLQITDCLTLRSGADLAEPVPAGRRRRSRTRCCAATAALPRSGGGTVPSTSSSTTSTGRSSISPTNGRAAARAWTHGSGLRWSPSLNWRSAAGGPRTAEPWEIRSTGRPFTYSAALCYVAVDRAIQIARKHGLPYPKGRWEARSQGDPRGCTGSVVEPGTADVYRTPRRYRRPR